MSVTKRMAKNPAINNDRGLLLNTRVQMLIAEAARPTVTLQNTEDCTKLPHTGEGTGHTALSYRGQLSLYSTTLSI
ncbi:unnamed protein product [Arctia plantaginis]|uniref:Uncharacterized protein n=1 Tax=Arctia plantaginis TaxID=874455 RepID=A0A8S0ZQR8_ARCPL|nr:unnamed protein product [Arctia plantaginis]